MIWFFFGIVSYIFLAPISDMNFKFCPAIQVMENASHLIKKKRQVFVVSMSFES